MKFHFTDLMPWFLFVNKILGAPYVRKGRCLIFDISYFVLVPLWFAGCTIYSWNDLEFSYQAQSFQLVIVFVCLSILITTPLAYCIMFQVACFNTCSMNRLLKLNNKIGGNALKSFLYYRRIQTIFICLSWIMDAIATMYSQVWSDIGPTYATLYINSCRYSKNILLSTSIFQLYGWTLVMGYSSQQLIKRLHLEISPVQNSSKVPTVTRRELLDDAMSQMRIVLEMKETILKTYGTCLCIYQLRTFIGATFHWSAFIIMMKDEKKFVYLFMEFLCFLIMSYMPHWIGQQCSNEVSLCALKMFVCGGE